MSDYATFLARKQRLWTGTAIEPQALPEKLFPFQSAIVQWAMRKGRAAIFADCGLGKSFMQLSWAQAALGRSLPARFDKRADWCRAGASFLLGKAWADCLTTATAYRPDERKEISN